MNIDSYRQLLQTWRHLGVTNTGEGAVVYGEQSTEPDKRWFHILIPPLSQNALELCIGENPAINGSRYAEELLRCNGVKLFGGRLYLFGVHPRTGGKLNALTAPWNIITGNIENRGLTSKYPGIVIGGSRATISDTVYIENSNGHVISVDTKSEIEIDRWVNTDAMLHCEISRYDEQFRDDHE